MSLDHCKQKQNMATPNIHHRKYNCEHPKTHVNANILEGLPRIFRVSGNNGVLCMYMWINEIINQKYRTIIFVRLSKIYIEASVR